MDKKEQDDACAASPVGQTAEPEEDTFVIVFDDAQDDARHSITAIDIFNFMNQFFD